MAGKRAHTFKLPDVITTSTVDDLLDAIETNSPHVLTLDATSTRDTGLIAEGRLIGALARVRWMNVSLHVIFSEEGCRLPGGFLATPAGFVLTQAANESLDSAGQSVAIGADKYYQQQLRLHNGILGGHSAYILPWITKESSAPAYPTSPLFSAEDAQTFRTGLMSVLAASLNLSGLRASDWIAKYAFEILQNTNDHGTVDLSGNLMRGTRAMVLRRHELSGESVGEPIVDDYLAELRKAGMPCKQLLEITIADSGIGVPARIMGDMNAYEQPMSTQRKLLDEAISQTGTSKRRVLGAGLGLPTALRAVEKSLGVIVFRTGHLHTYRHYIGPLSSVSQVPPDLRLYELQARRWSLTLGTAVSFLVPA